jgi:hypothetical protein
MFLLVSSNRKASYFHSKGNALIKKISTAYRPISEDYNRVAGLFRDMGYHTKSVIK